MSTSDASRAGQFVAQFPEALARQWLTSRGADQAERGACCAPDKQVFSGALCCVGAVFGWWCGSVWQACWGEPARHCGPAAPIGAMSLYGYNANTLHHFIAEVQCGPGASGVGSQTALLRELQKWRSPKSPGRRFGLWRLIKHYLIRRMTQLYSGHDGSQTVYD